MCLGNLGKDYRFAFNNYRGGGMDDVELGPENIGILWTYDFYINIIYYSQIGDPPLSISFSRMSSSAFSSVS